MPNEKNNEKLRLPNENKLEKMRVNSTTKKPN